MADTLYHTSSELNFYLQHSPRPFHPPCLRISPGLNPFICIPLIFFFRSKLCSQMLADTNFINLNNIYFLPQCNRAVWRVQVMQHHRTRKMDIFEHTALQVSKIQTRFCLDGWMTWVKTASFFAIIKTKWVQKCDSTSWHVIYIQKSQLAS